MPLQNIDDSKELEEAKLADHTESTVDSSASEETAADVCDGAPTGDAPDAECESEADKSEGSDDDESCEQISLAIPDPEAEVEETDPKAVSETDETSELSAFFKEAPPYDPNKPRRVDGRFDFIELLIFTLATVFVLTTFFFRHSIVDGDSMQNTLQDNEILIISGLFYTPERYDIVVLEDYSTGLDHPIVKRVIATEGETVRITTDGRVYVNNEEIRYDFVFTDMGDVDGDGRYDYTEMHPMTYTVPEGKIFVLGDHRDDSHDSRAFKAVDTDTVLGKVLFRIYPLDRFGDVYGEEVGE